MKNHKPSKVLSMINESLRLIRQRPLPLIFVLLALPIIYLIVYATGGIKFVYSHSMYIPIVFAGIYYGVILGVLTGFFAAILLGPLMPIDTLTNEMQDPQNWLYRMLIFILIGGIIGYAYDKLRKDTKHIEVLMSSNQETKVPNTNALKK